MAYGILAVGLCGMVLGYRFKVSAVIAASLAIVVANVGLGWLAGSSGWNIALTTLVLLIVLQAAYLVGLFLSQILDRVTIGQRR